MMNKIVISDKAQIPNILPKLQKVNFVSKILATMIVSLSLCQIIILLFMLFARRLRKIINLNGEKL